jgi:hypothetical protein
MFVEKPQIKSVKRVLANIYKKGEKNNINI